MLFELTVCVCVCVYVRACVCACVHARKCVLLVIIAAVIFCLWCLTWVFKFDSQRCKHIVQELCESRGGCPELSVLTSLLVSMDVKIY